jgi:hypothetical protein
LVDICTLTSIWFKPCFKAFYFSNCGFSFRDFNKTQEAPNKLKPSCVDENRAGPMELAFTGWHVLCNNTYLSNILFFSGEVVGWCCLGLVGRFMVFV